MRAFRWLMLALLTLVPTSGHAAERVRLAMSAWAGWTPALVGEAQGMWRDLGLDVIVTVMPDDDEVRRALADGRADLTLAMIGNHVGSILAGQDLVILGEADWSHGGDKVVLRRGVKPADLRGVTIGVYLDLPSVRFFLHRTLTANGLTDADVRVEEVLGTSTLADAFVDGKYPLIVNFDPEALRSMREGDGRVLASSATFPGVIPEGFAMRRGSLSPELLERFFRGWFAAVVWSRDPANWSTYAALLRAKAFTTRTTEADLLTMVAAVRIHDAKTALERNAPDGGLDLYLKDLAEYLRAGGKLPETWDAKRVVDTTAFRLAAMGK
jgi:NitT/TauT family transport system substrate-binding protein